MSLGIAVIGTGMMGEDHALRIEREIKGAHLAAVADIDLFRAQGVVQRSGGTSANAFSDPLEAIHAESVDAVIVATPDEFHTPLTLESLRAGKPVLCEKPLAPTSKEATQVLDLEAELADSGSTVRASLGFMRRFDPGCLQLKERLRSGRLGPSLMVHCLHRNVSPYPGGAEHTVNASAVHEFDFLPWLLDSPIASVSWHSTRSSSLSHRQDPQLMLIETGSGVLITLEMFMSAQYGYEVGCEVLCEQGTTRLNDAGWTIERHAALESRDFPPDATLKYAAAYAGELRAWLRSIQEGMRPDEVGLATAWDGYTAAAVAEAAIESMQAGDGRRVATTFGDIPALYRTQGGAA